MVTAQVTSDLKDADGRVVRAGCDDRARHAGCDPGDVSSGRLLPQPVPVPQRATRARVDDVFNCHNPYPAATATYHGIALAPACNSATTPPYIDNLKTAIARGCG